MGLRAQEAKIEDQGNALSRLEERVAALVAAAAEAAAAPSLPPVTASADLAEVQAAVRELQDSRFFEAQDSRRIFIFSPRLMALFKAQGAAPVLGVLSAWLTAGRQGAAAAAAEFYFAAASLFV